MRILLWLQFDHGAWWDHSLKPCKPWKRRKHLQGSSNTARQSNASCQGGQLEVGQPRSQENTSYILKNVKQHDNLPSNTQDLRPLQPPSNTSTLRYATERTSVIPRKWRHTSMHDQNMGCWIENESKYHHEPWTQVKWYKCLCRSNEYILEFGLHMQKNRHTCTAHENEHLKLDFSHFAAFCLNLLSPQNPSNLLHLVTKEVLHLGQVNKGKKGTMDLTCITGW